MKILCLEEFEYFDNKTKINESLENLSNNESDFGKYLRTNTPMIYAFMTDDIPDAIKVGYTNQGVKNRLNQWMQKYHNVTELGQWTASEFNKIGEKVFFMDHPVHHQIEQRGYANLKPDDKRFTDIDNIYVSKEFFNKYKGIDKNEADALSEQIITDIIEELKNNIKNNTAKINLYKFISNGSIKNAGKAWSAPNTFEATPLQDDCIRKAVDAKNAGKTDMLMAAVMRFGKTAATYWIIKECDFKYVVVTSAKADTRTAWRNDINHKDFINDFCFIEFDGKYNLSVSEYNPNTQCVVTESFQDDNLIQKKIDEGKTVIIYATLQDLAGKHEKLTNSLQLKPRTIKEKHRYIFENQPDLLVIDETHYGSHSLIYGKSTGLDSVGYLDNEDVKQEIKKEQQDAKKLNDTVKSINAKYRLQCSGTPYFILASGEFAEKYANKEIISDVTQSDMIEARDKWINDNPDEDESNSPYFGIPNVYKFGMKLTKRCVNALKNAKENANMHELFRNDKNGFIHKDAVVELMENIFGANNKKIPGWLNESKIKNGEIFKHMVMVLPHIDDCNLMKELLIDEHIVNPKEREIIIAVERRTKRTAGGFGLEEAAKDSDSLNAKLEELENQNKHSLTITVNRFLTGVSVPLWDSMLYMKDTQSPQEYDQNIMRLCTRCIGKAVDTMTGDEMKLCKKANVYVVDFKINRMFDMVIKTAEAQLKASKQEWKPDLFKKYVERILKTTPMYSANQDDSVFDKNTESIVSGMHELTMDDMLKKYIKYNKTRSIEDTIDINDFNHFTSNLNNAALLKSFSPKELNSAKMIMNTYGEDEPDVSLERKTNQNNQNTINKKNPVIIDNVARLMNMIKKILYSAMCMGIDKNIDNIDEYIQLVKTDKYCGQIFESFRLDIDAVNNVVKNMDSYEKQSLNFYISQLNYITKDKDLTPVERVQTCMSKLGRLDQNEVITPKPIVEKMIGKLSIDDFKNAESILEVNSKNGEFVSKIYEDFGKEVANKVKIIASSAMTKQFIRLVLRTLGLNEDNLIEINDTENYNIKDFLDMDNNDIIKENGEKKFDIILQNPPYDKNLHLKFLEKMIEIGDTVISIQPIRWLQDSVGSYKKHSDYNKFKESISKHIKHLDIIDGIDAEKIFNAGFPFDCAIYVCDLYGGYNYEKYSKDKILDKILLKCKTTFKDVIKYKEPKSDIVVSLIAGGNKRKHLIFDLFTKPFDSYYYDNNGKRLDNGLTFYENRLKTAWGNVKPKKEQTCIHFNNIIECENFYNSTKTNFFRYIFIKTTIDVHVNSSFLPFMNDYTKPWTDKRFYEFFDINEKEQKEIENYINEKQIIIKQNENK